MSLRVTYNEPPLTAAQLQEIGKEMFTLGSFVPFVYPSEVALWTKAQAPHIRIELIPPEKWDDLDSH